MWLDVCLFSAFGLDPRRHALLVRGLELDKVKPSLQKSRVHHATAMAETGLAKVYYSTAAAA